MTPDILFVNPGNKLSQFGEVSKYATVAPPLGVAMLASFVREKGFRPEIIDAEAENWGPEKTVEEIIARKPRMVGLTAFTTKMTAAGRILSLLKETDPHIKTVIGGHHPSAIPEVTLFEEKVDYVIKGEGYYPIAQVLEAIKNQKEPGDYPIDGLYYVKDGVVGGNPPAPLIKNLDELPLPAWDLLPMAKYKAHHWQCWNIGRENSFALVFSSLGCPFGCEFCSVNVVYGKRGARYLSPQRFVESIEFLVRNYNTKHLEIIDDTFTLNRKRVMEICELLIEKNFDLNMWCFGRTDRVDPVMLEKMKKAGINWVFLGIEAGNEQVLDNVLKKQNLEQITKATEIIRNSGIYLGENFVFGLPGDDLNTMEQTIELAVELNPDWANFFLAMAYPGTRLYQQASGKGILPEKWEQYGFFAPNSRPLPTRHLSSKEIINFRDEAFKVFFRGKRYLKKIEEKFGPHIRRDVEIMASKELNRNS